jgi:hypothetical protein
MKRTLMNYLRVVFIIYIAWTCYTRGKYIPNHMEKAAEGIENVGSTLSKSLARMK